MTKLPIPSKCTAWHSDLKKSIADTRILPHISVFQRKRPRFPQGVGPVMLSPEVREGAFDAIHACSQAAECPQPSTQRMKFQHPHLRTTLGHT